MIQGDEKMLFNYIGEITVENKWSALSIKFSADDNTLYILIPKDNDYVKNVIVNIFGGKYGFMACSESSTSGAVLANNYTLSDGMVDFSLRIAENKIGTIKFDLYKMDL